MQPSLFPGFFVINLRGQNETINNVSYGFRQIIPYPFANILCLFTQSLGIGDRVIGDGCKQLILVIPVKWRLSYQHLIEEDAKGPPGHQSEITTLQGSNISPVHTFSIGLVVDNLRSNVVWGSAKCLEILILTQNFTVFGFYRNCYSQVPSPFKSLS